MKMTVQQLTIPFEHEERTMTTNIKLKLIGAFATIALFALPAADAFAGHYS